MMLYDWQVFVQKAWKDFPWVRPLSHVEEVFVAAADLSGEAGEVQGKLKKWIRDGKFDIEAIKVEMGDTLFGLTALGQLLGITLEDMIEAEMAKIGGRKERGTLPGSGDDR